VDFFFDRASVVTLAGSILFQDTVVVVNEVYNIQKDRCKKKKKFKYRENKERESSE